MRTVPRSPSLAELQLAFQAAILDADRTLLGLIEPGARAGRETMLGVYLGAYMARLIGILRAEYPRLAEYLGDDEFNRLARSYFSQSPSRHRNARWVGDKLPAVLAVSALGLAHPAAAELAALERALGLAFDAPESPELTLESLGAIPPDQWADLVLSPHPSAIRLDVAHNTFEIWQALKSGAEPPAAGLEPEPVALLVWRQENTPFVRKLAAEEAMLWDVAARGARFSRLCELAAVFGGPGTAAARVASALCGWLTAGVVTSAEVCLTAAAGMDTAA